MDSLYPVCKASELEMRTDPGWSHTEVTGDLVQHLQQGSKDKRLPRSSSRRKGKKKKKEGKGEEKRKEMQIKITKRNHCRS